MSFNLPPGVSTSDIPGNRPSDAIAEKIYDDIYKAITFPEYNDGIIEKIADRLFALIENAYQNGVSDGIQQAKMDAQFPPD